MPQFISKIRDDLQSSFYRHVSRNTLYMHKVHVAGNYTVRMLTIETHNSRLVSDSADCAVVCASQRAQQKYRQGTNIFNNRTFNRVCFKKRNNKEGRGGEVNHSLINIYYLIPISRCRARYKYVCMLRMLEMIKTVLLYSSVQVLSTDMIKMNNMGEYIYTEKGSVYIYPPPLPHAYTFFQ